MGIQMLALPLGDGTENKIFSSYTLSDDYFKRIEPAGRPFEELVKKHLKAQSGEPEDFLGDGGDGEEIFIEEETEELWWEKEHKETTEQTMKNTTSKDDNYYAILGIEDLFLNANEADIRKAYKRVALIYHPDKNKNNINLEESEAEKEGEIPGKKKKDGKDKDTKGGRKNDDEEEGENITEKELTDAERKNLEINNKWLKIKEAYDCLLNADKRRAYDSTFEFDETIPDDEEVEEKEFFLTYGPTFMKNSIWSKRKPIPKIGDMNTPIEKVKRFYQFWYAFTSWRDFVVKDEYNLEEAGSRYEKRQMEKENKKMKATKVKEEKIRLNTLTSLAYKHDPRVIMEEVRLKLEREKDKLALIALREKEKADKEQKILDYKNEQEALKLKEKERLAQEKTELIKDVVNLGEQLSLTLSKDDIFNIQLNAKLDNLKALFVEMEKLDNDEEKLKTYKWLTSKYFMIKYKEVVDVEASMVWNKEQIIALQKACKKFPGGVKNRWGLISDIVTTKPQDQIIKMCHYLTTNPGIKIDGDIDLHEILNGGGGSAAGTKKNDLKNYGKKKAEAAPVDPNAWSDNQQKQLELAMKKYSKSLSANERWSKISKDVEGKDKTACVDRYKVLSKVVEEQKKRS